MDVKHVAADVKSWFTDLSHTITNLASVQSTDVDDVQPEQEKVVDEKNDEKPAIVEKENVPEVPAEAPPAVVQEKVEETKQEEPEDDDFNKRVEGLKTALFGFADQATKTVKATAEQLKSSMELEKTILGDFDSEQKKFVEEKSSLQRSALAPVAPWVGMHDENVIKKQILALSLDSRNFVRDPPSGIDYDFDFGAQQPVALATLDEDPNLRKMRFQLVPKQVKEDQFWRNYFYRVSLIKQSAQLSTIAKEGSASPSPSATSLNEKGEPEKAEEPSSPTRDAEFLSDQTQPQVTEEELEQVRQQLGIGEGKKNEEEWENEILAELTDYELVSEQTGKSDKDWEDEISNLLQEEEEKK